MIATNTTGTTMPTVVPVLSADCCAGPVSAGARPSVSVELGALGGDGGAGGGDGSGVLG